MKINYKRVDSKSGKITSIVCFLHGYGSDGADLLGIGDVLSEHLPDTLFIAPDAPMNCQMSASGFQWFPIPTMDGSSEKEALKKLNEISSIMNEWMDGILESENVKSSNAVLFGFSQGTMLSLHMGPRRSQSLGGIIGFSGKIVDVEALKATIISRPPVLLVHGDQDEVVSPLCMPEAVKELEALKFKVRKHVSIGAGHEISSDGLNEALRFLKDSVHYRA